MIPGAEAQTPLDYAVGIVRHVCHVAAPLTLVEEIQHYHQHNGVVAAIKQHDTPVLFGWLMQQLSFQGIADSVAEGYIAQHGSVTWADVARGLQRPDLCSKLSAFASFHRCNYVKSARTCAMPSRLAACPLPTHRLRNGRLNQTAYSLFLPIRDVTGGDLVDWIDQRLAAAEVTAPGDLRAMRAALVEPMRSIYGVSEKVLALALASLLMTSKRRKHWFEVGASFVVIDTLVHNFLHRTGILSRLNADHPYGVGCYRPGGCSDIIYTVADYIDVSELNPHIRACSHGLCRVQSWRYCAEGGVDVCNGNRINDRDRCANI